MRRFSIFRSGLISDSLIEVAIGHLKAATEALAILILGTRLCLRLGELWMQVELRAALVVEVAMCRRNAIQECTPL
jgi:hypothetical protein